MKRGFLLSVLILVTAIQLLTYSSAQCEQLGNTGMPGIALILAEPADDDSVKNGPDKSSPIKVEGAEIPVQDTVSDDDLTKNRIDKSVPAEVEKAEIPVQENASDHFNRGVMLDNSAMYKEAIESYKKAIMIKPDYAEAYYNLAFSYLQSNDVKFVHEKYMLLKDINPKMADDLYDKALIMVCSNPENKFVVQVGAFRNIQNAKDMIDKLRTNYMHAQIEAEDGYSKVRLFGMDNKEAADLMIKEIKDKFNIDPFLVPAR